MWGSHKVCNTHWCIGVTRVVEKLSDARNDPSPYGELDKVLTATCKRVTITQLTNGNLVVRGVMYGFV